MTIRDVSADRAELDAILDYAMNKKAECGKVVLAMGKLIKGQLDDKSALAAQVAERDERIAKLEGELVDMTADYLRRHNEAADRLLQVAELTRQLEEARKTLRWMSDSANWQTDDEAPILKRMEHAGETIGLTMYSWGLRPWIVAKAALAAAGGSA